MNRALRRHHERVAKARRIRILLSHGAWVPPRGWGPKVWHSMKHLVMNEPGWLDARDGHSTGANQDSSSRAPHLARVRCRPAPVA